MIITKSCRQFGCMRTLIAILWFFEGFEGYRSRRLWQMGDNVCFTTKLSATKMHAINDH